MKSSNGSNYKVSINSICGASINKDIVNMNRDLE